MVPKYLLYICSWQRLTIWIISCNYVLSKPWPFKHYTYEKLNLLIYEVLGGYLMKLVSLQIIFGYLSKFPASFGILSAKSISIKSKFLVLLVRRKSNINAILIALSVIRQMYNAELKDFSQVYMATQENFISIYYF